MAIATISDSFINDPDLYKSIIAKLKNFRCITADRTQPTKDYQFDSDKYSELERVQINVKTYVGGGKDWKIVPIPRPEDNYPWVTLEHVFQNHIHPKSSIFNYQLFSTFREFLYLYADEFNVDPAYAGTIDDQTTPNTLKNWKIQTRHIPNLITRFTIYNTPGHPDAEYFVIQPAKKYKVQSKLWNTEHKVVPGQKIRLDYFTVETI